MIVVSVIFDFLYSGSFSTFSIKSFKQSMKSFTLMLLTRRCFITFLITFLKKVRLSSGINGASLARNGKTSAIISIKVFSFYINQTRTFNGNKILIYQILTSNTQHCIYFLIFQRQMLQMFQKYTVRVVQTVDLCSEYAPRNNITSQS